MPDQVVGIIGENQSQSYQGNYGKEREEDSCFWFMDLGIFQAEPEPEYSYPADPDILTFQPERTGLIADGH